MTSEHATPCCNPVRIMSVPLLQARSPRLFGLFVCLLMVATAALAGTTGKVAGKIIDSESKEGLIGAAVMIEGTTLGGAADIDGNYFILNVPPGKVNLRISSVGYAAKTIMGIQVTSDQTSTVDAGLTPQSLQGEEVTIIAERELVQQDRTFGSSSVPTEELDALPITNLNQAVEIQAGIVDGHFRGGRSGEVLYLVDGVSITDAYDNSQGTQIDQAAVQELQVISGTFNAEYGQAQSGVVNIITKEGGDKYNVRLGSEFGDYLSTRESTFMHINNVSPTAIQDYRVTVDGPVPRTRNLYFYANGRYQRDDGWLYGKRRWGLEHKVLATDSGFNVFPNYGDNSWASMNSNFERFGYGKLTWSASPTTKLTYSNNTSKRIYRDFDNGYKFLPDATKRRYRNGYTNLLKFNQTLTKRIFYELNYTNTFSEYHDFVYPSATDSRYVHPAYNDFNPAYTLEVAGNDLSRFRRWTQTNEFAGYLSAQATELHLLKAGFDVKLHQLFYEDINLIPADPNALFNPSGQPDYLVFQSAVPDVSSPSHDKYLNKPAELGIFVQDKFELRSLIINAGLRYDYFDPDGRLPVDPKDPSIYEPLLPDSVYQAEHGSLPNPGWWYKKVSAKSRISPRLGIAYPMSDQGVFHFSYGHFVQRPTFERMYTNPEFELESGVGLNTVMGNPDLKMEETVSYEFGFQQQIAADVAINTSIFYRDIRNLVATDKIVETYKSGTKYAQYVNRSFGEVKGITLSIDRRLAGNFSAFLDYTYQTADGDASNPQNAYNASRGNNPREPNRQLVPLDWDRRHTINVSATYAVPRSDGWGGTILATYGSGLPYSPVNQGIRTGYENDGRKPDYKNVDLSAFKKFRLDEQYSLTLSAMIQNVFDIANENGVYNDTGRAGYSQEERTAYEVPYINSLEEVYTNPSFYSRPRVVRVGLEVAW
jgi:hypothetical protein